MKSAIETLYHDFVRTVKPVQPDPVVGQYQALLTKSFSKQQNKYLLRLIDRKDLLAERLSFQCFTEGMRLGILLIQDCRAVHTFGDLTICP